MALHKDLTGADLHEPKGVASATSGQVYRADGAGSGSWQTLTVPEGTFRVTTSRFAANGTWTKPSNCFLVHVTIQAGGGGGCDSTGALVGSAGGSSSFGSHVSATGGGGGQLAGVAGSEGTGSSGYLNITSNFIGLNSLLSATTTSRHTGAGGTAAGTGGVGGTGGGSLIWIVGNSLGSTETVTVGQGGAGGGGAGSGVQGFVFVEEYISIV